MLCIAKWIVAGKNQPTGKSGLSYPLTVVTGVNDQFVYTPAIGGVPETFTLAAGTAPANGAALTGTAVGNIETSVLERATAGDLQAFSCQARVASLTVGTAYWLDLGLAAVVGGTGQAKNLSVTAFEV